MSSANLTLPQDGHAIGTNQRSFTPTNISSPLLIVIPRVESESSHSTCRLVCYTIYIYILSIWDFFFPLHINFFVGFFFFFLPNSKFHAKLTKICGEFFFLKNLEGSASIFCK